MEKNGMDSLSIAQFEEGFTFGLTHTLPIFSAIFFVGLSVYLIRRFFRI